MVSSDWTVRSPFAQSRRLPLPAAACRRLPPTAHCRPPFFAGLLLLRASCGASLAANATGLLRRPFATNVSSSRGLRSATAAAARSLRLWLRSAAATRVLLPPAARWDCGWAVGGSTATDTWLLVTLLLGDQTLQILYTPSLPQLNLVPHLSARTSPSPCSDVHPAGPRHGRRHSGNDGRRSRAHDRSAAG